MALVPPWWHAYDRAQASHDIGAAFVVVVMLVPQSLAYAQLAKMPLQAGLYASILPLIAYALFGTSSTLSVGPVAVISLMTAAALGGLAVPGTPEYLLLAAWLALISGVVLLVAGALRMGFVANLMSHPVIAGFMTGAAVLIVLGQMKPLLGMQAEGETALALADSLVHHWHTVHPSTALAGIAALALLWTFPRAVKALGRRLGWHRPVVDTLCKLAPIVLVILAISATTALDLDVVHGLKVVGYIPGGMPTLGLALPSVEQFRSLVLPACIIGLIGFVESVSVAQSLAIQRRERVDPDAELRGLGVANIAAAVSGGFPVTGGLSRTIVNFSAGARTPLAGVYAAVLMLGVVSFLTGLFNRLPNTVLAAAIVLPVMSLIDLSVLRHAWKVSRADAWAYLGTALGVMGLGIEPGILLGVAISVMTIVWQASRPHIAEIGRVPGTAHYRNRQRAEVVTYPHLLALRVDADLFFANARPVERAIEQALAARPSTRDLVLDMSAVNNIDITGLDGLKELNENLKRRGISLHLAEVKGPLLDRLERSGILHAFAHRPFRFTHDAFRALNAHD